MATLTVTVTGMTCGQCVDCVEDTLKGVRGGSAEVDPDANSVTVDDLVAVVERVGCRAQAPR